MLPRSASVLSRQACLPRATQYVAQRFASTKVHGNQSQHLSSSFAHGFFLFVVTTRSLAGGHPYETGATQKACKNKWFSFFSFSVTGTRLPIHRKLSTDKQYSVKSRYGSVPCSSQSYHVKYYSGRECHWWYARLEGYVVGGIRSGSHWSMGILCTRRLRFWCV